MDRCPICRGRVNDNNECKRCGAELSILVETQLNAEKMSRQALVSIAKNDFLDAEVLLKASQSLKFSSFNQNILKYVRTQLAEEKV